MTNEEIREKVESLKDLTKFSEDMDGAELLDVVNNNDEVVGVLPRGVIWDSELRHNVRAVDVFLVNEKGEVLLQTRSLKKKYWPGGYDFSCGESLKSGESYEQALKRGLREELGVIIDEAEVEERASFKTDKTKGFACFGKVYLVKVSNDQKFSFDEDETLELRWKSVEEIRELNDKYPDKFKGDFRVLFEMVFGIV